MKAGSLGRPGSDVGDLERAAHERLEDAEVLFAAGRYSAAIVMGIYALEIRLKVVICRRLDLPDLPKPFEIHELQELLILTGFSNKITTVKRPRDVSKNWDNLEKTSRRVNELRYKEDPTLDRKSAETVLTQLRGKPGGVLQWLEKQI